MHLKLEKIEPLFLRDDFKNPKIIEAYTKFIYDVATMLNPDITDVVKLASDIEKIVRIEKLMRLNVK